MGKIRTIRPEFCQSETITALSRDAQLHFVRLWTHCDDEGRAVDNPKLIRAGTWPLDDSVTLETVDQWHDELAKAGLIVRYENGGKRYLQVTSWTEHQKPKYVVESKFPSLDDNHSHVVAESPTDSDRGTLAQVSPNKPLVVVEVVGEVEVDMASGQKAGARRDELFEAVADVCGVDWRNLTGSARGALNKAVAEIRGARGQPHEVPRRAVAYRVKFPQAAITPTALAKHWPSLGDIDAPVNRQQPASAGALARAKMRGAS